MYLIMLHIAKKYSYLLMELFAGLDILSLTPAPVKKDSQRALCDRNTYYISLNGYASSQIKVWLEEPERWY